MATKKQTKAVEPKVTTPVKPKRPTVKELQAEIERLNTIVTNQDNIIAEQVNNIKESEDQIRSYAYIVDSLEAEVSMLRRENKELLQELYKETPPPKGWWASKLAKLLEKMGA